MSGLLEISEREINRLSDIDLHFLLRHLLCEEARDFGIPGSGIDVSTKITVSDEGQDGLIEWKKGPERTDFVPSRTTLFQCKATRLTEGSMEDEALTSHGTIKPRIKSVFRQNGTYVIFYNGSPRPSSERNWIKGFRKGLRKGGLKGRGKIEVYTAKKIAAWANRTLAGAIYVLQRSKSRPTIPGFQTWHSWKNYESFPFKFVADDGLDHHLADIRSQLALPQHVVRLVGPSGIGKTRLALEVFKPPNDKNDDCAAASLAHRVVYINARGGLRELPRLIAEWRSQQVSGVFVVDNCPPGLHDLIAGEVFHNDSQFSVLTIDDDMSRSSKANLFVMMDRCSDEMIKELLEQRYKDTLSREDIARVAKLSCGFPLMAELSANAQLQQLETLNALNDDELVRRLLWARSQPDEEALKCIQACSVFQRLGFQGRVESQRKHVAKVFAETSSDAFYKHLNRFRERRRIIDQRGDFIRVIPIPLAVTLAAEFWTTCSPEKAQAILKDFPPNLTDALCERMAQLHVYPKARELIEQLCNRQSPFVRAEVISSAWGSRLFRAFADLNPSATTNALDRVLSQLSRAQLYDIKDTARRNLVWTLEILCFFEDTFELAASCLLRLATTENESWANNATNQFLQLFPIRLSGTQTPPQIRLAFLDNVTEDSIPGSAELKIKALGSVFEVGGGTRTNFDVRGKSALELEWRPKIYGEIYEYWRGALSRLIEVACQDTPLGALARSQISDGAFYLLQFKRFEELGNAIIEVTRRYPGFWQDGLEAIERVEHLLQAKFSDSERDVLTQWKAKLAPRSVPNRLRLIVSVPSYDRIRVERSTAERDQEAIQLAHELSLPEAGDWLHEADELFMGEQRKGFVFGQELGKQFSDPWKILKKAQTVLHSVSSDIGNAAVLGGFLNEYQKKHPEEVSFILDCFATNAQLMVYLPFLTTSIHMTKPDLERIVKCIWEFGLSVRSIVSMAYGQQMNHLSSEDMSTFIKAIMESDPWAPHVGLEMLIFYQRDNGERFAEMTSLKQQLLLRSNLLPKVDDDERTVMEHLVYTWVDTAASLLKEEPENTELAGHVMAEILATRDQSRTHVALGSILYDTLDVLLSRYVNVTWPMIASAWLQDEYRFGLWLQTIMPRAWELGGSAFFSLVSHKMLMDWARKNRPAAPVALARHIPLITGDGPKTTWTPLARDVFKEFGDDDDVLDSCFSNLSSFGWSGSAVPAYEGRLAALRLLTTYRSPRVRKWANETVRYFENLVTSEKKREEEQELGVV